MASQRSDRGVRAPLMIADQGYFWVGVTRSKQAYGTAVAGQMYVQYQIPSDLRHPYPIVMVHGGGAQGLDFLGTPDGRPGWATYFLKQGYAVYVVDRPGHGRAPYHPDLLGPSTPPPTYEFTMGLLSAPEKSPAPWPQARLHTQWPGTGEIGDPALDQFQAGQGPFLADMAFTQELMQRCGVELLDRIGPAVLMTHSMSGPFGWLVADARPHLVKGIVAIEPIGPPFGELVPGLGELKWGLTAIPITYDPPVSAPSELRLEIRPAPRPGLIDCFVQAEPARKLPNLGGIPIVVVTGEASLWAQLDHGAVDYLVQAGANAEHLRLEQVGIHGNGHIMMGEKNSDAIAEVLAKWIDSHVQSSRV